MARPCSRPLRFAAHAIGTVLLASAIPACAPLPPADGPLRPWQVSDVQRYAARLEASPSNVDDPELVAWIRSLLYRIDREHGTQLQVFVIDQAAPQADLVGGRLLRLRTGLLRELDSEQELLFVLAHELAHRRLGHVAERATPDWDPVAAEIAADLDARRCLRSLGLDGDVGRNLLERLATRLQRADDLATIRRRIDALAVPSDEPDAVEPYRLDPLRFTRLLARYR